MIDHLSLYKKIKDTNHMNHHITITHDSSDYILNLNAYVNNKTEHTTYKISGRKGKQKLGVLEKKWFRVVVLSYPATNCSSVSGVCSLKLEYGQ